LNIFVAGAPKTKFRGFFIARKPRKRAQNDQKRAQNDQKRAQNDHAVFVFSLVSYLEIYS
jgi:hypothetical protein